MYACICGGDCKDQRIAGRSQFFPTMWVQGIKLKPSDLAASVPYLPRHLTGQRLTPEIEIKIAKACSAVVTVPGVFTHKLVI